MELLNSISIGISWLLQHIPGILISIFAFVISSIWIHDKYQSKSTIRRNYPVIGRFRYLFEELGVYFRQYFIAHDREEMPFNRADRSWVYRAAKNVKTTLAFGSTRTAKEGDVLFANSIFPSNEHNTSEITFGSESNEPYVTDKYFHVSGMSFGALSKPSIMALTAGAKNAGIWVNTGEGGPSEYHLDSGADLVVQIGTAKYGMRDDGGNLDEDKLLAFAKMPNVKMFEIKGSQGAKPGKGGILPANKVTAEVARSRGIEVRCASISPNSHKEISDAKSLFAFIKHIKQITGKPVGFKLCIGNMVEFKDTMAVLSSMTKEDMILSKPDFLTIDSGNGGTGAAPMGLIDATGMNIKESLPKAINILEELKLIDHIKIIASGKLITPVDVAWALCAGADVVVSARGFLFSQGCIQSLKCHENNCPTGITTHQKHLQKGLVSSNKAKRVENYARTMIKEVDDIAHTCGVANGAELTRKNALIFVSNQETIPMVDKYKAS